MNSDWNEYTDMLFAVDTSQKILGTFFSKGDFDFINNPITGIDVMWLPVNNENKNEYKIDQSLPTFDNIIYLFHRDRTTTKQIYEVTNPKYNDNTITFDFIKEHTIQEPSTQEYISNTLTKKLTDDINAAHTLLLNNLDSLIPTVKTGGDGNAQFGIKIVDDKKEFDTEEFNKIENLVNDFEKFVDAFITYPTVLKLNSLSVEQVNQLFGKTGTGNNININIDNQHFSDSTKVKDDIFEFLFYSLKITYQNKNPAMIKDVLNQFVINEEQTKKSTEIAKAIAIYKDFEGVNTESNTINTIIHIKHLATMFTDMVISLKNDISSSNMSNINIVNDVFDIIVNHITTICSNFQKPVLLPGSSQSINKKLLDIIKSLETNNKDFITSFEKCIKDNVSDKIITFVKINNFGHNFKTEKNEVSKWNKRFDVLLNSINDINLTYNTMIVNYNDVNKPYYHDGEKIENIEDTKYTKTYLFGKFSQIFPPNMKNPDIANQMKQIAEKVKGGKPVFVMGYGASGSGKTSSLIYLKKVDEKKNIIYEEQGIIVDMCKQICDGTFNQIELTTEEIFMNDEDKGLSYDKCSEEDKLTKCVSTPYKFDYDNGVFKMVENKPDYQEKHPYRQSGSMPDNFGEILKYLIDSDRLVKATTNNPQSSRSHSFAFIKFIGDSKTGYLIVGDFAGVENTFNCDNIVTIRDFLNIKNDKNELFYGGVNISQYRRILKEFLKTYIDTKYSIFNTNDERKKFLNVVNNFLKLNIDTTYIQIDFYRKKVITNIGESRDIFKISEYIDNIFTTEQNFIKKIEFNDYNMNTIEEAYKYFLNNKDKILKEEEEEKQRRLEEESVRTQSKEKERIAKIQEKERIAKQKQLKKEAKEQETRLTNATDKVILSAKNKVISEVKIQIIEDQKLEAQQKIAEEQKEYSELSKKEINENYIEEQINSIYKNYKNILLAKINGGRPLSETEEWFKMNDIEPIFIKYIYNILKSDFVNEDLTINMEVFSKYTVESMYTIINTIIAKIDEIKETGIKSFVDEIKKLDDIYIPFNKINKRPYNTTTWNDNLQRTINKFESVYKFDRFLKTKLDNNTVPGTSITNKTVKKFLKTCKATDAYNRDRSEKMNIHLFTDKYLTKSKKDLFNEHDVINQYANSIFYTENEILTKVKLVLTNILERLKQGQQVCSHRRYEGYFINQSLQDMREDIKNIFYEKQKDSIFISPDYVNLCLEKYCPTHSDCFNKGATSENHTIKSIIFQKIFQFLNNDNQYTVNQFYQDILVSVFCVFNISRSANNPPSVPYIDINELKIALKKYDKSLEKYNKNNTYDVYVNELKSNLQDLKTNLEKTYYKITGKILGENLITHPPATQDVVNTTESEINNILKLRRGGDPHIESIKNENTFDEFQTSSIQQVIFEDKKLFEYIFTGTTSVISNLKTNELYALTPDDFRFCNKLIETIDNNNAVSAIGTLEFLDQISKYHTTQTICFLDQTSINKTDYINIYDNAGTFKLVDKKSK